MRPTRGLLFLLALLDAQTVAFSLYPTVDPNPLASALNISIGCLNALNTTLDCDDDLFQWTVTVDDHWWVVDNLTTLCTPTCSSGAAAWRTNVQLACLDDDLVIQGVYVPAASVAGRFVEGLSVACLQDPSSQDWCMVESQNWVGSDVVRPDCTVHPTDPSCLDPTNVTADNARLANLYPDSMICTHCFIQLFNLRLSSDYLADSDYSDYLVDQLQDIQDVCSSTIGPISTRYWAGYIPVTIVSNATTTATASATASAGANSSSVSTASATAPAIATPTPTRPGMIANCDNFTLAESGDTCYGIALNYSISLSDFETWNPVVGVNCTGLWAGYYYCVGIQLPPGFTTSSACQTVDFSYGVTSKDPTAACAQMAQLWNVTTGDLLWYTRGEPGCYSNTALCMPPPCELAQVGNGSTCDSLAKAFSTTVMNVTARMVQSWNPNILGPCDNLTVGQYVCASAPGGSYVPPPNAPPDVSGGGEERGGPGGSDPTAVTGTPSIIVTSGGGNNGGNPTAAPQPTQADSIPSACSTYAKAQSGNTCASFAAANNISPDNLYMWNTVLGAGGANCTTEFWAGYYYCVGITGSGGSASSTTTSPTPTSSAPTSSSGGGGGGSKVPSPTQSGITSNCNAYKQAQSGQYCSIFASDNGITTSQLYAWNTVLGTNGVNCTTEFLAGYYYCVGVSGGSSRRGAASWAEGQEKLWRKYRRGFN